MERKDIEREYIKNDYFMYCVYSEICNNSHKYNRINKHNTIKQDIGTTDIGMYYHYCN